MLVMNLGLVIIWVWNIDICLVMVSMCLDRVIEYMLMWCWVKCSLCYLFIM